MVRKIERPLNNLNGLQRKFAGSPMSARLVIALANYSRKLNDINGSYINLNSTDVFQEIHDWDAKMDNEELQKIYASIVELVNDYAKTKESTEHLSYKPQKKGYIKNLFGL